MEDGLTYRVKTEYICAFIGQQIWCVGTLISGECFWWGMGLTMIGILYTAVAAYSTEA